MTLTGYTNEGEPGSSTLSVESAEHIHNLSMPPAEEIESRSQKRRSGRSIAAAAKKAKTSVHDNSNSTSPATPIVSPRTARRTTAHSVPNKPGNEAEPRRTSSRRVPETWSAQHLLSNPKSKLAHCNLNVVTDRIQA